jgi:rare lipoprotein A
MTRKPQHSRIVLYGVILLCGCAGPETERIPYGEGYSEKGVASWYGEPFHGRRTANGEVYNMWGVSAAHRTLPLGTVIRVTRLDDGRTVQVRVNDRGPFVKDRIVDLSYAAAKEIGMDIAGTADVRLEVVRAAPMKAIRAPFTIQVGAFAEKENAERLQRELRKRYPDVRLSEYETDRGVLYRVRVGRLSTETQARRLAERLRNAEDLEPFVTRQDS